MKKVILSLLMFSTLLFSKDFFTIDEFLNIHQDEIKKMSLFDNIVQKEPTPISIAQKKPIKIAIIYPAGELSDYWVRSKKAFERRLELLKINYVIDHHYLDSNNLIEKNKKIKNALSNGSDYLVFTLNLSANKKLITQLLSQKKTKIIIQNLTTPLKEWEGNQPFMYVGFDHIEGTKLLANYFLNKFPDGAKYAMLYFKEGYISQMRGDSFIDILNENKKFELLDSYYTDGDSKKSFKSTIKILKEKEDIDFIYSCSTDISIGAVNATNQNKKNPLINGWGGGSKELEMIKEKKLEITVMRMNDDNGIAMAEAIKLDLEKNYKSLPQIYSGKFILIDKNTSQKQIEKYKKKAFRYSGL
jgi:autoinducer 2-binding protein LuxP